jgi:hypothetical protein
VAVLDAEVRLDTTLVRDPFDQGSGLMSIEVDAESRIKESRDTIPNFYNSNSPPAFPTKRK